MQARQLMRMSMHPSDTHATTLATSPNHKRREEIAGTAVFSMAMTNRLEMRNEVQQSNDKNPHNVNEMPIARDRLVRLVWRSHRHAKAWLNPHICQHQQPNNHMCTVQRS